MLPYNDQNIIPPNGTTNIPPRQLPSRYEYIVAIGSPEAMNRLRKQQIERRKTAKMLISVAILFAICYLPIHLLNISRFDHFFFKEISFI